jgi:hypothetical protein
VKLREIGGHVQIEQDPALVGVQDRVGLRAPPPAARRVDVHHLGPVVSEQARSRRTRHPLTEVHDLDAVQGNTPMKHAQLLLYDADRLPVYCNSR